MQTSQQILVNLYELSQVTEKTNDLIDNLRKTKIYLKMNNEHLQSEVVRLTKLLAQNNINPTLVIQGDPDLNKYFMDKIMDAIKNFPYMGCAASNYSCLIYDFKIFTIECRR